MAYEKKNGDMIMNRNADAAANSNAPSSKGTILYNGKELPFSIWPVSDDKKVPNGPTHSGSADLNGEKQWMSLWFKGSGPMQNKRPNVDGNITIGDWQYRLAMWERDGSKGKFWSGSVDLGETYRKPAYKKTNAPAPTQPNQAQSAPINDGFSNQTQAPKFELDDEIPF